MKKVEMAEATAPLSEYARKARKDAVVVTRRGKPLAAVVPLDSDDWEDFVVSQDPGFVEVIKRSEARYKLSAAFPSIRCVASTRSSPPVGAAAVHGSLIALLSEARWRGLHRVAGGLNF